MLSVTGKINAEVASQIVMMCLLINLNTQAPPRNNNDTKAVILINHGIQLLNNTNEIKNRF
jgi:hypothetical protein